MLTVSVVLILTVAECLHRTPDQLVWNNTLDRCSPTTTKLGNNVTVSVITQCQNDRPINAVPPASAAGKENKQGQLSARGDPVENFTRPGYSTAPGNGRFSRVTSGSSVGPSKMT